MIKEADENTSNIFPFPADKWKESQLSSSIAETAIIAVSTQPRPNGILSALDRITETEQKWFKGIEEIMSARAQSGGGNGDDLGSRVSRLEAHVSHIQSDIHDIRQNISEIQRVSSQTLVSIETLRGETSTSIANLQGIVTTSVETLKGDTNKALAELRTRVDHLPSKGFIVTGLATTVTILAGLTGLLKFAF